MHLFTQLKRLLVFLTPHFRVGLFLYTPPSRYRKEAFEELQPGAQIVLGRTQRLVEQEYLTWLGFKGFYNIKSVHRRT